MFGGGGGGGLVAKSCPTFLWVHGLWPARLPVDGISQATILEQVAISFSRESSQPRDWTHIPYISGGLRHHNQILYCWATSEAHVNV